MKNWLLLLLLPCFLSARAQLEFRSFAEVLRYADTHAIAIQSAKISEQVAQAEKKERASFLIPDIDPTLGYNDNISLQPTPIPAQVFDPEAPEGTYEELTFGTRFNYSAGIQAQWDILNPQKIFATKTAELQVEESRLQTEVSRFNTYNQLASTYYAILLTQEAISIYKENARVAATMFEHADGKYQNGVLSDAERNLAEIKKRQGQRTLNLAQHQLEQLFLQLQSQLNTREAIAISDTPDRYVLLDTAIQTRHPEAMREAAALETYESMLQQQKAAYLPTLSLYYQYNMIWATDGFMDFSAALKLPQQVFGVKLSLSGLFDPASRQKVKQTEWTLQRQRQQLENTLLVKDKEDELLHSEFRRAFSQMTEDKQILSLQRQNDVHAENQYQAGILSLDRRLDQYDDLLAAQDQYLQSLAEYTLAQYQIYIRQLDYQPYE